MQEEIEEKTVQLAITGTRISIAGVMAGIRLYMRYRANKRLDSIDSLYKANKPLKSLKSRIIWNKAETLLYTALIGYIHYEAPEEE